MTTATSLEEAGVDPGSVSYVEIPFPEAPAALASGNVDAAFLMEPLLTIAMGQGAQLIASNMVDAGGEQDLLVGVFVTSGELVDENADVVDRFRRAMAKSSKLEMDEYLAQRVFLPAFDSGALSTEALQHVVDISAAENIVPADMDVTGLVAP